MERVSRLRQFRPDIQGMRALAILIVVVTHCKLLNVYGGVDVFFVISGYVITGMLLREIGKSGRISLPKFYAARIRRLMPIGLLVAALTLVGAWLYGPPLHFPGTALDGLAAVFFALNWRLAAQGVDYFSSHDASVYQHYWSLCVEEQFYVVWPATLLLLALLSRKLFRNYALVVGALVVAIGVSFYLSVTITMSAQPWAYFGSHTRAWELALGALIAVGAEALGRMNTVVAAVVTWVGLAMMLATAALITSTTPLPGYAIAGPVMGAALVIAGGCADPAGGAGRLLSLRPLTFIGDISYGWYLWHWPLLMFWPAFVGHDVGWLDGIQIALVSLLIAVVTFYTVEQPFRTRVALRPRRILPAGVAAMVAVGAALVVAMTLLPLNIPKGTSTSQANAATVPTQALVQEATKLKALPGDLTPSLDKASKDMTNRGCIDDVKAVQPKDFGKCALGDLKSSTVIVVLGDSHAWQWGSTLHLIGLQYHWKIITVAKSGCSPQEYTGIFNPELGHTYVECNQWRAAAIAQIVALKPAAVVITGQTRKEAIPDGTSKTIAKLTAGPVKPRMIFLEDTPYPGQNIPDCLASYSNNVQKCAMPYSQAMTFPSTRRMERQAAVDAGARIIGMNDWLCTPQECPAVIGGKVVYFDQSHLTRTYAESLTATFGDKLLGALSS